MTFDWEPKCQLVLMWLMAPSEPCHSGGMLNKTKMDRNLTLLTFEREPCQ